ncbi:MAG: exopolysaccharide biosynthesis polyprenyl glycosylphosphotransferase [Candidatus Sulfotelmatobacter sp.]|nr:exopolysaccharide biosynthesis polyprenyl glycosylphosphotransferase [Candidatus Sulfotelmatobacter sp.]
MGHFRRQVLLNSMKLFDLGAAMFAFALAAVVVSQKATVSLTEFFAMRVKIQNFILFAVLMLIWHQIFVLFGMYASRRLAGRWDETLDALKATTLGTFVIMCTHLVVRMDLMTPEFLIVFWLAAVSTTASGRLIMRVVLRNARLRGRNLRDMLIVGTNPRAVQFACKMRDNQFFGYRVIGFVDQQWTGLSEFSQSGFSLACNFDELLAYLRTNVVDEVVVALPMRSLHSRASEVAAICEEQGILVRFISNLFDGKMSRPRVVMMEGDSIITHNTVRLEGWPVVIKRLVDIVVASAMILLLLPVFLLTALLIKLTSSGPVFFVQKRLGLNKRHFGIYKFRTMVVDAEKRMKEIEHLNEVSGPVFKIKNDPRITSIGKLLRKTSIDELPQLFNVLMGDMSLVGPRPLPLRDYEGFSEDWQRRRFSVRPGVTCLWQIGGRSSISFEQWMELDLQYIDKWSLLLDFKILLKTIPAVLKGSGAA